jgi:RNA ligase (TIGR02306 family)
MELEVLSEKFNGLIPINDLLIGVDVSNWLGIQKWEIPISPQMTGTVRGNFPSDIPKTDQERCQNLVREISFSILKNQRFEITEKLEGSSMTCFIRPGEDGFGVCSRNLSLKEGGGENTCFWKVARKLDIENKMREVQKTSKYPFTGGFAIQGELVGPGIQDNIYKLSDDHDFFVFDVYDIQDGRYLNSKERIELIKEMGLKHVPVLFDSDGGVTLAEIGVKDVFDIISFADGVSVLNTNTAREGVVFKCVDGGMTFKSISNKYLMDGKNKS